MITDMISHFSNHHYVENRAFIQAFTPSAPEFVSGQCSQFKPPENTRKAFGGGGGRGGIKWEY